MAMTDQQKLDFVHRQTKLALSHVKHFDQGGIAENELPPSGSPNQIAGSQVVGTQNPTFEGGVYTNPGFGTSLAGNIGSLNSFQAQGATLTPGTNIGQLNQAYNNAQSGIGQANNLAGETAGSVGQGISTQNFLTNQLTQQAQGQGLAQKAAQAQLSENTGQNINQAAALAASTRGAGTNAGLVAQNAGNTAAQTQQNAVNQSNVTQANLALGAQGQLGNLASQQVGQGTNTVQLANQAGQNEQGILQGANQNLNNAQVSAQNNLNTINAQTSQANANAAQNAAAGIGQALNGIGSLFAFAKGGVVPTHLTHLYETAKIKYPEHFDMGGMAWQNTPISVTPIVEGSQPNIQNAIVPYSTNNNKKNAKKSQGIDTSSSGQPAAIDPGLDAPPSGTGSNVTYSGVGDVGPSVAGGGADSAAGTEAAGSAGAALGSAGAAGGAADITAEAAPAIAGAFSAAAPVVGEVAVDAAPALLAASKGGKIPGKPKVNHDAYSNDTVDAKLTPGEVVIDLNTLKDKGKLGKMARFVAKEIERKKAGRKLI